MCSTGTHSFLDLCTGERDSLGLVGIGQGRKRSQAVSLDINQRIEASRIEVDTYYVQVDGTRVPQLEGALSEKPPGFIAARPHVTTFDGAFQKESVHFFWNGRDEQSWAPLGLHTTMK